MARRPLQFRPPGGRPKSIFSLVFGVLLLCLIGVFGSLAAVRRHEQRVVQQQQEQEKMTMDNHHHQQQTPVVVQGHPHDDNSPMKPPPHSHHRKDGGGILTRTPETAESDRVAALWVFVYCASKVPVPASPINKASAAHLGSLLALAMEMDFRVMLCDEIHAADLPPHPRLYILPTPLKEELLRSSWGSLDETSSSWSPPKIGLLLVMMHLTDVITARHVLLLSPSIRLGWNLDSVRERLTALLLHRRMDDPFDPHVVVPKILLQMDPEEDTTLQVEAQLPILSHGHVIAEAVGGRVTMAQRLRGMHAGDPRATAVAISTHASSSDNTMANVELQEVRVDLPTALVMLAPFSILKASLDRAAKLNISSLSFKSFPDFSPETQFEISLAMMQFDFVVAARDVVATYVPSSGNGEGCPYCDEMQRIASGGEELRDDKPRVREIAYRDIDSVLPVEFTSKASLHQRLVSKSSSMKLRSSMVLFWDPYCDCTGINIEAINFLVALEAKALVVRAVAGPDCWCRGMPDCDRAALARLRKPKLGCGLDNFGSEFDRSKKKTVWVSHKPVDAFPKWPYSGAISFPRRPSYVIGRTMIEHDVLSAQWVRRLNTRGAVDEIWVPSTFLLDVFKQSGVRSDLPIRVIPEPIDIHYYDPSLVVGSRDLRARLAGRPASNTNDHYYANFEQGAVTHKTFNFFSNFKWEHRKGWDILLSAYFKEFTKDDDVTLYIKTFLYLDPTPRNAAKLNSKIEEFAFAQLHRNMEMLPKYVLLLDETPASEMPALYQDMDCFVLPTRGEGWGLPMQEAMAMGLPTIATNWGGNIDFMNDTNSFLIDVEDTEPISGAGVFDVPHEAKRNRKPRNAKPSERHLRELMRRVFIDQDGARRVGRIGREHIAQFFSREAVADIVVSRLLEINAEIDTHTIPS